MFPQKLTTLSERAYCEIKTMIAHCEILPGAPLVLQGLATKLGMSRMPVVEAVRRLERDGLVVLVPQWGAAVRVWSQEEIQEAHSIRGALEGEAARLFVRRARAEDKRHLAELSDRFDQCAMEDDSKCDQADLDFHLHIVHCTGYQRLGQLVENSNIETAIITGLALRNDRTQRIRSYAKREGSHKPIVEALLGDDPGVASQAVFDHVHTSLEEVLRVHDEAQHTIGLRGQNGSRPFILFPRPRPSARQRAGKAVRRKRKQPSQR